MRKCAIHVVMAGLAVLAGCEESESPSPPPPSAGTPTVPATSEATTSDTSAASSRPADAVAFGGHWYRVYEDPDMTMTWHDKKAACEKVGGYLACIETEAEQDFIAELADGAYLSLGATDEAEEDDWRWINGSQWQFTAWMDGQPNDYGGDEHYLATYDGGEWVDVAVEGSDFWMPTGYICEWDK
jgi:hypothetical protein